MSRSASLRVLPDPEGLATAVAEWLGDLASASDGTFRVALSGGSTPEPVYAALASDSLRRRLPWERIEWFWTDERCVPSTAEASNYGMVFRRLLSRVPAPAERVFPIPVEGAPESAARAYEATLREIYGAATLDPERPFFDVVLLGLGGDGHTASLFPGSPALEERRRWVVAELGGRPEPRVTMTYPLLESCRRGAFLVSGAHKAEILARVRGGGADRAPAARLAPLGELLWWADRAAAGG